jgi:glycosyltransferase involved in cell wall biosynthesis
MQAQEFGFKGLNYGFMLATGGFDMSDISIRDKHKPADRKIIIVKGREGGLVGRALNVVEAMKRISKELMGYQIKFIMVTNEARLGIKSLEKEYHLDCEIVKRLPYAELSCLFAKSLISISASTVDGTPGFLLESLAFGAFPIHSKMSSIDSWIEHGVNGLTFDVDNIDALSNCILNALSSPGLINSSYIINGQLVRKMMDREKIKTQLNDIIEQITIRD